MVDLLPTCSTRTGTCTGTAVPVDLPVGGGLVRFATTYVPLSACAIFFNKPIVFVCVLGHLLSSTQQPQKHFRQAPENSGGRLLRHSLTSPARHARRPLCEVQLHAQNQPET